MSAVEQTVLDPVGVRVEGIDLVDPSAATVEDLVQTLAEHGVAVMPGQEIDDAEFLAFLQRFGQMVFTEGEAPLEGFPDLNVISNVGRTRAPRSSFHVDTGYVSAPPAYTALRAVDIPSQGGQTLFTNQYRAYDTLPDDVKAHLSGRTVTHVVTGVDPTEQEGRAEHPVFRVHPVSGRTALYLSTPQRCVAVSGMDEAESAATVAMLLEHCTAPENTVRHTWASGDVVMWDNGCVMHRADHDGVVGDRVMHRGMVTGYAGALPAPAAA